MTLASLRTGRGPSITFVHGFTQTRSSWNSVVSALENQYSCTTLDAPGHGDSPNGRLSLPECGDAIASTMSSGTLIGYSMGARMALHSALQHPEVVQRLVLISGTAGIDDAAERAARIASDEELATHIEHVGVPTFVSEWLQNPMFSGLDHENTQLSERLGNTATGLADSLRFAGTGTQQPLWDYLTRLSMPVLIIAGSNDQKFTGIAQRMNSLIPHSTLIIIENAGHTVHLEQTEQFIEVLTTWLRETSSTES